MSFATINTTPYAVNPTRQGLASPVFFGSNCPCPKLSSRSVNLARPQRDISALPGVCFASVVASPDNTASDEFPPPSQVPHLRWGTGAVQGPRETMEDVVQVIADGRCGFFFATVFDGHSGIAAAQYLEKNLYNVFSKMLDMHSLGLDCSLDSLDEGLCCPLELHDVLTECYKRSDEALLKWLKMQPKAEASSGCTATTALVRSDRIIIANVGDSRAVLCKRGVAMDLTTEHRVYGKGNTVQEEIERIESGGGWVHDGRVCGIVAVSRAFGDALFKSPNLDKLLKMGVEDGYFDQDFASKIKFTADPITAEPDVFEVGLDHGNDEFLVVGTDGLWDVLSSSEVVSLVRSDFKKGKTPEEIAERLAQLALKRYTADNTAVVVIDLLGEEGWKASGNAKSGKKGFLGLF